MRPIRVPRPLVSAAGGPARERADLMARSFALHTPYHPTTFLERGVLVAFTTPALTGARVRASERSGLELIVANPSGGRGFYVLPWAGVQDFCRPTLHDRQIQERASLLTCVTPRSIREIACDVAGKGYAGREARAAAARSRQQDVQARLITNYLLLLMLIAQMEGREAELSAEVCPDLELRAKRAVARAAPALGMDPDAIAVALEDLAELFKGVGLGSGAAAALHVRTLSRLVALRTEMNSWSAGHFGESAALADVIRITAELTISCASLALDETRAMTGKMPQLLAQWRNKPDAVVSRATRPEWLLDGWEPICALWELAAKTEAARHTAIAEMVQQIPILPKEVGDWFGTAVKTEASNVFRRWTELNKDWRTGLPFIDLVERNERLRALAV